MSLRLPSCLVALALSLGALACAAGAGAGAAPTTGARPAAGVRSSARAAARDSSGVSKARKAVGAPRTLQEIQIEGEIPVPQVLFIRASDQRRFMDFHHRRYLGSSLEIGERTILPTGIGVTSESKTRR